MQNRLLIPQLIILDVCWRDEDFNGMPVHRQQLGGWNIPWKLVATGESPSFSQWPES